MFLIFISLFSFSQNLPSAEVATKLNECLVKGFKDSEKAISQGKTTVELIKKSCEDKFPGQVKIVAFKGSDLHFTYEVQITSYSGTSTVFGMGGWGPEVFAPAPNYAPVNHSQAYQEKVRQQAEEKAVQKALLTLGPMASHEQITQVKAAAIQKSQSEAATAQAAAENQTQPAIKDMDSYCMFGPVPPECGEYLKFKNSK